MQGPPHQSLSSSQCIFGIFNTKRAHLYVSDILVGSFLAMYAPHSLEYFYLISIESGCLSQLTHTQFQDTSNILPGILRV